MASAVFLMFTGGALGLTVESDTPDAFCPPVAEVRQAVASRVGDVHGGGYEAHYGLSRDASSGSTSVRLVLQDRTGAEVLRRDIPVQGDDCADASLAIAIVLERYFAGVIRPPIPDTPATSGEDITSSEPEPSNTRTEETSDPSAPSADASVEPAAGRGSSGRRFRLRGAAGIGSGERPMPVFHGAFGYRGAPHFMLLSEFTLAPFETQQEAEPFRALSTSYGWSLGVLVNKQVGRKAELFAGPLVGGGLEIARIRDERVSGSGAYLRGVFTLGAQGGVGFSIGPRTSVGVLAQGTALLSGTRFVVAQGDESIEVLPLPTVRGSLSLYFEWAL